MTKALDRSEAETEFENEQDKIFIEMPIPRTLSEIGFLQAEKDIREGKQGTGSTLYGIVTGMKSDMSGTGKQIERFFKITIEGCVFTMVIWPEIGAGQCVFQMVVVFILSHAAFGPYDPRKDAP